MSRYATKWFAVAAFLITVGAVAALSHAAEAEISLSNAWVRPTLGAGRTTAAYVTVTNAGTAADRLTAVDTPGANSVEVHTAGMEEGIMRMRRLEGLDIPVGETVTMAPGGYHIMFIGLKKPFKKGESCPVTILFEKAGRQTVTVSVKSVGAMKSGMKHDMKHDINHDMKKPVQGGHHGK